MGLFNRATKRERETSEAESLRAEEQGPEYGGYIIPADVGLASLAELGDDGPRPGSVWDERPPEPLTAPASDSPEDRFKFELEQWIGRARCVWERTNADELTGDLLAEIGSPPSVDTTGLVGADRSMLIASCKSWANAIMAIQIRKTYAPFWGNAKDYMTNAIEIK